MAERAGVDRALVSRVVNEDPRLRIRDETRRRIVDAVAELGYTPSRTARNLRLSRTGSVGLVVPELTNPVWAALTEAMEGAADSLGLTVLVASESSRPGRTDHFVRLLDEQFLDGLLLAAPVDATEAARISDRNVVFVNQVHEPPARSVVFDDGLAIRMAVDALVELGHIDIAHIGGPRERDATRRRAQAFSEAVERLGLPLHPIVIGPLSIDGGVHSVDQVLDEHSRVTAVVVANVRSAVGVLRRCAQRGVTVPDELSVVCVHDNEVAQVVSPPLTAVAMPVHSLGERALQALVGLDSARQPVIVRDGIAVTERGSSGPPRAGPPRAGPHRGG
ncbi:LacI family DNA-binding transcriptional regulator [Pseudonocardia nematodicida]|uniref:LacI family DNA-binding transcriptional regulator n=1 Tax=Pseudonocardia nematodicida TaxID=1206997 RepID=A0ABV1KE94_9PSEU